MTNHTGKNKKSSPIRTHRTQPRESIQRLSTGSGIALAHQLQRKLGNQGTLHYLQSLNPSMTSPTTMGIQSKLSIGQPGDPYEREADAAAQRVVSGESVERITPISGNGLSQAMAVEPEYENEELAEAEEHDTLQTHSLQRQSLADDEEPLQANPLQPQTNPNQIDTQGDQTGLHQRVTQPSKGKSLPNTLQTKMETHLGKDFSHVQLHDKPQDQQDAKQLNARAFTRGSHIWLGQGESANDPKLMAHELTHVVQQRASKAPKIQAKPTATKPHPATTKTRIPTVETMAKTLYMALAMPNASAYKEKIFRSILLAKTDRQGLKDAFEAVAGRRLEDALSKKLSGKDLIRAQRYLQYGTLRLADKFYFAIKGAGTDEDTVYRLLPKIQKNYDRTESDFIADYGEIYPNSGLLPDGRDSRIAGALGQEFSAWELDKAKALLVFGKLRVEDKIRIATNRVGTDEDMLFGALEKADSKTIRQRYQTSYRQNIDTVLKDELSGDDYTRALLLLAGKLDAKAKIKLATEGWGTDEQAIYDALAKAGDKEIAELKIQFDNRGPFYQMLVGDLGGDEMARVEALLTRGKTAVDKLKRAGTTAGSDLVSTIKMSAKNAYKQYRQEFNTTGSPLRQHLSRNADLDEVKLIDLYINGSIEQRLRWAVEGVGTDEDYIFHVLQHFTDDKTKKALSKNKNLLNALQSDLSTSDYYKVIDLLQPSDLSPEEKAKHTEQRIERERSWINDMFSNTADALDDERRELQVNLDLARADGQLSAEELKIIAHHQQETDESLEIYIKVRDEIESIVTTILVTAAAITAAVLSGGLASGASAAMIASALSKAAIAGAVASVIAKKAALGDRFDVFGADGAITFGAGAIDGVMNVLGTPAASKLVSSLARSMMRSTTQQTAHSAFRTVGRELLEKAVEGSISSVGTGIFEAAANEKTWKGGFADGMGNVLKQGAIAAGTGSAASVGLDRLGKGYKAARARFGKDIPNTGAGNQVDTTDIDLGGDQRALLTHTRNKRVKDMNQVEYEVEMRELTQQRPQRISRHSEYHEKYDIEIESNGHIYRRNRDGSGWCRYSTPECPIYFDEKTLEYLEVKARNLSDDYSTNSSLDEDFYGYNDPWIIEQQKEINKIVYPDVRARFLIRLQNMNQELTTSVGKDIGGTRMHKSAERSLRFEIDIQRAIRREIDAPVDFRARPVIDNLELNLDALDPPLINRVKNLLKERDVARQARDDAKKLGHDIEAKKLGYQVNRASEALGEIAGYAAVFQRFPGPPPPRLKYPRDPKMIGNSSQKATGPGRFDMVFEVTENGRPLYIIVEAKGATGTVKHGVREVSPGANKFAEQGSPEYYDSILESLKRSSNGDDIKLYLMLENLTARDQVRYIEAHFQIKSGSPGTGGPIRSFERDIKVR